MRLVVWSTIVVLVAGLVAATVAVEGQQPYRATQSENALLLLISNVSVFSADFIKLQSDIVYHGGVYAKVNPAEYNLFRPYNPLVLFADHAHHASGDAECASSKKGLNVHVHLDTAQESQVLPYMAVAAKLNPKDDDNWANGAYMLYRTQHARDALLFFDQGLQHNPSNATLRIEYARLLLRIGTATNFAYATNLLVAIRPQVTNSFDLRRLMDYLGECYVRLHATNDLTWLKAEWATQFPDKPVPALWR